MAGRHTDDTVADLPATVGSSNGYDSSPGDVDLSTDPFDDNLSDELAARQPIRLTSRTTLALGGVVLIVGGFLGGVLVQKNFGTTAASAAAATGANGRAAGAGNGGAGGFGGGQAGTGGLGQAGTAQTTAGRATTGTVKLVDGSTIYLTTTDGQVITVKTSSSTTVKIEQPGALKDLPAGATVTVTGTANSDGIITATQVTTQK